MPNYIRAKFEGGYYFFTVVTYERAELFRTELARRVLREAIEKTRSRRPFETIAFCLLFEHLHCVWKLPEDDADYSKRWSSIKGQFSREYLKLSGQRKEVSSSRARKGEVCVWQRRFWEHQIRDENDLQRHVDYIHYNPVKHGLVQRVEDWPWSTYHKYAREGFYGRLTDFEDVVNIGTEGFGQ
ncbi:MAG: REP-associated tyrosine transposase [Planctomycetota bacterium]|jgi:putative transposase